MQLLVDRLAEKISACESRMANSIICPKRPIRLNTRWKSLALRPWPAVGSQAQSPLAVKGQRVGEVPRWKVRTPSCERSSPTPFVSRCLPTFVRATSQYRHTLLASELAQFRSINCDNHLAYSREDILIRSTFGFVVPFIEKRSIHCLLHFSSVKFAGRAPEDHVRCEPSLVALYNLRCSHSMKTK